MSDVLLCRPVGTIPADFKIFPAHFLTVHENPELSFVRHNQPMAVSPAVAPARPR